MTGLFSASTRVFLMRQETPARHRFRGTDHRIGDNPIRWAFGLGTYLSLLLIFVSKDGGLLVHLLGKRTP